MAKSVGIILLLLLSLIYCGTIPHYEERLVASKKEIFQGYSLDEIWDGIFATIAEMDYLVTNTDKEAGHIYAEGEEPYWSRGGRGALSFLVRPTDTQIIITCQAKGTYMAFDPQKEISRFFRIFRNKLR